MRKDTSPAEASGGIDPAQVVMVHTNAPDALLAKRIAHELVEDGLAACAHVAGAGVSMYMWQGSLEGAEELPITIKTVAAHVQALHDRLRALHPYQVPEFIVTPVIGGSPEYLDWVREQTAPAVRT